MEEQQGVFLQGGNDDVDDIARARQARMEVLRYVTPTELDRSCIHLVLP